MHLLPYILVIALGAYAATGDRHQRIIRAARMICKVDSRPQTFIRCCRIGTELNVDRRETCLKQCVNSSRAKKANGPWCDAYNYNVRTGDCSLLSRPVDVRSSELYGTHQDYYAEDVTCIMRDEAPEPQPETTTTQEPKTTTTTTPEPTTTTEATTTTKATTTTTPAPTPAPQPKCGVQADQYQPQLPLRNRIIGGFEARPHSWPWQVSLQDSGYPFCGGTLLRVRDDKEESDIVLTAAHCVASDFKLNDFSKLVALAGNHDLEKREDGEQKRKAAAVRYHEDYTFKPVVHDLALIKLSSPIAFTDTIRPICLPEAFDSPPVKKLCIAAGWGRNNSTNLLSSPDQLYQMVSPVNSVETCKTMWRGPFETAWMCSGPLDGSAAVCNGDSGGVLQCRESDGRWTQYGVASFVANARCTVSDKPPVFARVSSYVDWIRQTVNEMTSL